MVVAVGNSGSGSANANSIVWAHTLIAGSDIVLVVGLSLADGINGTAVDWDADGVNEGLTFLTGSRQSNAGAGVSEIWYLVNPSAATGSSEITATLTGAMNQNIGGSVDFTGATTPDNNSGSVADTVTSVSDTVTGDDADNFIFDVLRHTGGAPIEGADQVAQWNVAAGGDRGAGSTQDGVSGGVMSWTFGSGDVAHSACRIPEAVAAGDLSTRQLNMSEAMLMISGG